MRRSGRRQISLIQINLDVVQRLMEPEPQKQIRTNRNLTSDPLKFVGPKLKIKRAKKHIQELEREIGEFFEGNPYGLLTDIDPKTGEKVFRVRVYKTVPTHFSAIIGDIFHNLRTALDVMICDLVRLAGQDNTGGNGFPIFDSRKKFLKARPIGKIRGVTANAERLIEKLKPYFGAGGQSAFWHLHDMDILDKHNRILIAEAANLQLKIHGVIPFLFAPPGGGFGIGSPSAAGSQPLSLGVGVPDDFKPAFPLTDNMEIYRCNSAFNNDANCTIYITFGKDQVLEGEPVLETLKQLVDFVERVVALFERHAT